MLRRLVLLTVLLLPHAAAAADPLETIRAFCRADGHGGRLTPRAWQESIAPLVTWALEPAWDRVLLISGYEIGSAKLVGSDVTVEVTYTILFEVTAGKANQGLRIEPRTYRLMRPSPETPWRVTGSPPPPHVFASEVDENVMATSLDPDSNSYLSDSAFIWEMLRAAGWSVPYRDTRELVHAPELTLTEAPLFGDVIAYYDGDTPYHVGFVDENRRILSATLNAGLRRTSPDAFPGTHRYLRFHALPATPTPERPTPLSSETDEAP